MTDSISTPSCLQVKPRILLADANSRDRSHTSHLLEAYYDVRAVDDGQEALSALHDWHPDLVLCDMATPKLTGMELLDILRGDTESQTTPFVLLFSRVNNTSWLQGIEAGADDCIFKPFDDYELMARIHGLLRLHEMRQEAQMRESELRAEVARILESIDEAFIALDPEWRITYLNTEAMKIHGTPKEDLLGKNIWEAYPEAVGTRFYNEYHATMRDRVPSKFVEFYKPYQTWFEVNVCPVSNGGIAIYFQDVTARKRTEIVIEGQKRAFELAINNEPMNKIFEVIVRTVEKQSGNLVRASILILDEDRKHLRLGAAPSLPQGYRRIIDGMEIGPSIGSCGAAAYTGKQVIVTDIATHPNWANFRDIAAKYHLEACWSNPICSSNGQILGAFAIYFSKEVNPTAQDWDVVEFLSRTVSLIIERDHEFHEREQAEGALKEANRRKDEFLAMLAHELRNPLAPISNALHILRMPDAPPKILDECESIMERQLGQMVRLVEDLMDVSRISRGKVTLRKEKVYLADVMDSALETTKPLLQERGHSLSVDLPEESVCIDGDFTRLAQIFSNLLNNAIKYTDPQGNIQVKAALSPGGGDITVTVSDNGIGISEENLPYIFDVFLQADSSLDRSRGGLGIGLTLVKNLVQLHGGTVTVYSEGLGKGSTFTVRLPVLNDNSENETVRVEKTNEKSHHEGLKILIVDDNDEAALTTGWMMEFMHCETRIAHNGKNALEIAKSFHPDVVMLDIGLPEMNGYEVCKKMRSMPELQNAVYIAQTGWGQDEHRRKAQEAGFDHYLVKPVDMKILEGILGKLRPSKDMSGTRIAGNGRR